MEAAREARGEVGEDAAVQDLLALVEQVHGVPVAVLALDAGVAGAYLRRPRGALILLNGTEAAARLRFTLAHELGHHVLRHGQSVDTPASLAAPARPVEVEANRFAAELLLPRPAVRAWLGSRPPVAVGLGDVVELAAAFGVSALVALFRLQGAGALPDRDRAARIRTEIEDGAHLDLRHRLGLRDLDDGVARARAAMPRLPGAAAGSVLDAYARGELPAERLAAVVRAGVDEARATLRAAALAPPDG